MVAPKTVSSKEKQIEPQSASSSPEPFQEPDGMTTIDLNKSDDYTKEHDIEIAKIKRKAQIRYVSRLMFGLCSIMFFVIIFITVEFFDEEYHFFNKSPQSIDDNNEDTSESEEDFFKLSLMLNKALFREKLHSGGYVEMPNDALDNCVLTQTLEDCCQIFRNTDLDHLSKYCTVNDMLEIIVNQQRLRKKRQIDYDYAHEHTFDNADYIDPMNPDIQLGQIHGNNDFYDAHYLDQAEPITLDVPEVHDYNDPQPSVEKEINPRMSKDLNFLAHPLSERVRQNIYHHVTFAPFFEENYRFPDDDIMNYDRKAEESHSDIHMAKNIHSGSILDLPNKYNFQPNVASKISKEEFVVDNGVDVENLNIHPRISISNGPDLQHLAKLKILVPQLAPKSSISEPGHEFGSKHVNKNHETRQERVNSEDILPRQTHDHEMTGKKGEQRIKDFKTNMSNASSPHLSEKILSIDHENTTSSHDINTNNSETASSTENIVLGQIHNDFVHNEPVDVGIENFGKSKGPSNDDNTEPVHFDIMTFTTENPQYSSSIMDTSTYDDSTTSKTTFSEQIQNHSEENNTPSFQDDGHMKNTTKIIGDGAALHDEDSLIATTQENRDILGKSLMSKFSQIIDILENDDSDETTANRTTNDKKNRTQIIDYDSVHADLITDSDSQFTMKITSDIKNESAPVTTTASAEPDTTTVKILESTMPPLVDTKDIGESNKNLSISKLRSDEFRSKTKNLDDFTVTEDVQSSQQSMINPCFYPYMNPYLPFAPNPGRVPTNPDSGFLKIIPASQPRYQNQPMFVLNPAMYYNMPANGQSAFNYVQNPFMSFPPTVQAPQINVGAGQNGAIQVSGSGGQYYVCNPIPAPINNIAGLTGIDVKRHASNLQGLMEDLQRNDTNSKTREATLLCPLGELPCMDNSKCIKNHHICDSEIHCDDSSDESSCSCRDRVGKLRICDGYCDCPICDDEKGCFGCAENEFSCDDWSRFRRSTCIPLVQRCDGIKQCDITGKDEMDCSLLADHIGNFPLNKVSNSVGFLHRNYKGKWYPTCFGTEQWAAQVCQVEAGPSMIIPKTHMTLTTDPYNGLFINILPNNEVSLVNTCVQDRAAFVECPPIFCGLRFLVNNPYREEEVDTSAEDMLNDLERAYKLAGETFERNNEDDLKENVRDHALDEMIENLEKDPQKTNGSEAILKESRVVGGKASQPAAWPWLVSIYKNGVFHCGGVLINELWIVTASHCVDRYWQYYYEIQAGALRRFSYSPMDQRRYAIEAIPHELYSKTNLLNDIALMKLSAPIRYNRYVRPICLPSESTAGHDYMQGPKAGSICTTVGWGATVEHGGDPDHMRQVDIPILAHCKHKDDSDVDEICAGLSEGGKDACQGDSGGPLMCRNPNNLNQWYLAGVVSHGEGCARPDEPGVYTKVVKYVGWIAENTRQDKFIVTTPLKKCPGYICKGTQRCIPKKRRCDKIVDCLLADDEMNCGARFKEMFKEIRTPVTDQVSKDLWPFTVVLGSQHNMDFNQRHSVLNETDSESSNNSSKPLKLEETYFRCTVLLQVVPAEKRCDKKLDCEDGTDEMNCTCADYIKSTDSRAICDGIADCPDLSDENDCVNCNNITQFTCRLSQKCIDIVNRCDGTPDCAQHEDEMNCVTLTNGQSLMVDIDDRPLLKLRGIVTINHRGQWKPLCLNDSSPFINDQTSLSTVICSILGFDEYLNYHKYMIEEKIMNVSRNSSEHSLVESGPNKCEQCCEGLYISCSNTSTSSSLHQKSLEQVEELYFAPWMAAVYINGRYECMGTLLNDRWIVTSSKCLKKIPSFRTHYVVAVLGKGKLHLNVKGPHEQIARIVNGVTINGTDITMLKLEKSVVFNRYVQAANINARKDVFQSEKCYAVGQNNEGKVQFVPVAPLKTCLVGYRCFEKKIEDGCKDEYSWSGTIICDSRTGWYPAAVFHEDDGHCGLSHEKKYTSVKFHKTQIAKIMESRLKSIPSPVCQGFLCPLGNCIAQSQVCDGISNCYNGEEEEKSLCYEKEKECHLTDSCVCPQTHLKCPSTNKCVPKSTYCDRVNDCGDFEDEPAICSCRNYLRLTASQKICDGELNCMDRSDEDPEICTCKTHDFRCTNSSRCVLPYMVCDGVPDCPEGDDEENCLSLRAHDGEKINAGEVITNTAGIWHEGCFNLDYTSVQLDEMCEKLGLKGSSAAQLPPPNNLTTNVTLRPSLDTFHVVWLRRTPANQFKLRMRTGNEAYVRLREDDTCRRLFLACI